MKKKFPKLIRHYYEIAPHIVHKINQQKDALTVWEKIYNELIIPCIKLIINTQYQEAYIQRAAEV